MKRSRLREPTFLLCLATFVVSVFISHIVMPWTGRDTILPFGVWSLFDWFPKDPFAYDLIYEKNGQQFYLSRNGRDFGNVQRLVWNATQKLGEALPYQGDRQYWRGFLDSWSASKKIKPVAMVKVDVPIGEYITMDPEHLTDVTKPVYSFEKER